MSSTAPAVTAVIPTHNRPDLMRAAVVSVLEQDYVGDIEVIIVFDACPIEVPDLEIPAHRTVRGVENTRTRGLAGGRNTGILEAAHDYVAFLDDDDEWLPGKLSAQMPALLDEPGAFLVSSAMFVDDGTTSHERPAPGVRVTHDQLLADRIAALHSSSFVFQKDRLREIGMIDEDLPGSYGEDYDVLLRATQVAPVVVVNRPLISVRWTGHSYFYGKWQMYADALRHLIGVHPELEKNPGNASRLKSQIGFALAAAGRRAESRPWSRAALKARWTNARAWLALAVSYRVVSANFVARTANRFGKGI